MKPPNAVDRHVGGRVRARRIELAMSEDDLVAALGTTVRELRSWEDGEVRIPAARLLAAQKALGVDSAFLFADVAVAPTHRRGGARDSANLPTLLGSPPTLEAVRLVRGFTAIRNRVLRDIVVDLVETLAAAGVENEV
jgi:transcriptional regulator with XRE-family HTH domain